VRKFGEKLEVARVLYRAGIFKPIRPDAPRFDSLGSIGSSAMQNYSRTRLRQVKRGTMCKELSAMRGFLNGALTAVTLPKCR
jgi:hypothetical protein